MLTARLLAAPLFAALILVSGCAYEEMSARPDFSEQPLQSLCDYGRPLVLGNRGYYQSRKGTGELLLIAHVANQPLEAYLNYQSVGLDYRPNTGLAITLTDTQGAEQVELIPPDFIECADDAMELELPADTFYLWASVGVKNRRLRLQVSDDGGLVMQHLWEEKGMMAVVMPMQFSGDGWASFLPDDPAAHPAAGPGVEVARIGDCQDLSGTYLPDGVSVRLDGSLDRRSASDQFFRPEIMADTAAAADVAEPQSLQLVHSIDGGIELRLLLPGGQYRERFLEAETVSCETAHWVVKGKKDRMPAVMVLTGSVGSRSEDLRLSRDREGALLVHGSYRSGGLLFLIPTGTTTDELFMRFPLIAGY